jgi:hypothetical protein
MSVGKEFLDFVDPRFKKYLDERIRYNKDVSLNQVSTLDAALRLGISCYTLAALINEELYRVKLSPNIDPVVWWRDNLMHRLLDPKESLKIGDVAFFGKLNAKPLPIPDSIRGNPKDVKNFIKNYPAHHLAVYIGRSKNSHPLYMHASYATGGVAIWSEDQFYGYRNSKGLAPYEKLHGVKRFLGG